MGLLILFVVLAVMVALFITVGGALGIVALVVAVAAAIWMVVAFVRARSPGDVARSAPEADLLGPGGPDDPR